MYMINDARTTGEYLNLVWPYLCSTRILAHAMGLDQIGDDASLMSLQGHVESEGFRRLRRWRAGPVGRLHWQHRMILFFRRVERLLPVMEHLQDIGEHIQRAIGAGTAGEGTAGWPQGRCLEHSRMLAVLAHTGAMSTWRYVVSLFRQDIRQSPAIDTSVAIPPTPPAQRFEDVHIRLTAKEYRCAITSMRGALKRRSDPKVPDNCAICLDTLLLRRTWHGLACGHVFHPKCLKVWLQTQCRQPVCPLCRYDVRTPKNATVATV